MKFLVVSLPLLMLMGDFAGQAPAAEPNNTAQTITPNGSQPSIQAPAEHFTGAVRLLKMPETMA